MADFGVLDRKLSNIEIKLPKRASLCQEMAGKRHKDKICWILADKSGAVEDGNVALARAIGLPFEVRHVHNRTAWRWVPNRARPTQDAMNDLLASTSRISPIEPPWPDLIISNDLPSAPYALAIKHQCNGRTLVIGAHHPRGHLDEFDLIVVPRHEMLAGPNVEPILGVSHGVTPEILDTEGTNLVTKLAHLPRPLVAVWIGGDHREYKLPKVQLEEICALLAAQARKHGSGLVVATSIYDSRDRNKYLAERLAEIPVFVWDGSGNNPFVGCLALADHIVITIDSEIEISQAAATGKPIHFIPLTGGYAASRRFRRDLEEYGAIREYNGQLNSWSYEPLREIERVGQLIREMIEGSSDLAQRN